MRRGVEKMNENDRYAFPENLKRLREERNLKGIQMAEKLKIEITEILEVSLNTLIHYLSRILSSLSSYTTRNLA